MDSHASHLLLIIWINNKSRRIRWDALETLSKMCTKAGPDRTIWCDEVYNGCAEPDEIPRALTRDLMDEHVVNAKLWAVVMMTFCLVAGREDVMRINTQVNRGWFCGLLAACQRQICLGNPKNLHHDYIFETTIALTRCV